MKRSKQQPERCRQRRTEDSWQRPASFSYHASRAERTGVEGREPSSLVDKRRSMLTMRFWTRRAGLIVAVVVGLICLASIMSVSTRPRIVMLESTGATEADKAAYARDASEHLSSSIWNRTKLTFDTASAAADLRRRQPELATVSVTLPIVGQRPIYYVTADRPAVVLRTVNGEYVLDNSGRALTRSGATPDSVPIVTDQSGLHAKVGQQVLSSREVAFITTLQRMLAVKNMQVRTMVLPSSSLYQLDVVVVGKAYTIKFNMHDGDTVRQQAGTYLALANMFDEQKITPAQYVDVRVPGRAYYQ